MPPETLALEQQLETTLAEPLPTIADRIAAYDGQRTWAGGAVIRTEVDQSEPNMAHFTVHMGGETGSTGWIIGTLHAATPATTEVTARYGIEPHLTASMGLIGVLPIVALIGAGLSAFLIGLLVAVLAFIGMVIAVTLLQSRVERHLNILFDDHQQTENTHNGST